MTSISKAPPGSSDDATTSCRLAFAQNSWRVAIDVDGTLCERYCAEFHGPQPRVDDHGRLITIAYPRFSRDGWFHPRSRSAHVLLAARLAWDIHFRGGVSQLRADLADSCLRSFTIDGGVSDVQLRLPAPRGIVSVQVSGGADNLTIGRPPGAAVRLHVARGTHNLRFDGRPLGATGGDLVLESANASHASDCYEILIAGGASRLTVESTP